MASAAPVASGRGGKGRKSLDAEVNLVPFIDLLSMCICFLLMTAVWVEMGAVNVKQTVGTAAPATVADAYELELKFSGPNQMMFKIRRPDKGVEEAALQAGTVQELIAALRSSVGAFSARIGASPAAALGSASQGTPAGVSAAGAASSSRAPFDLKAAVGRSVSAARLLTASGVSYGEMVAAMDVLREAGILSIGVANARAN